jgi:hypothetical protein
MIVVDAMGLAQAVVSNYFIRQLVQRFTKTFTYAEV